MDREKISLIERVKALTGARLSTIEKYYAITILASAGGQISWSCLGHWVGFDGEDTDREIREATLLDSAGAGKIASVWKSIGESYMVLRTGTDLLVYFLAGGNALVEDGLARSKGQIREIIAPQVSVRTGPYGFTVAAGLPAGSFSHAPSPKLRMKILKRDEYRCRVCGRRPADHVDIELHVHHIRPFGKGGMTVEENLITLCHTCHKGLNPHEEWSLFGMRGGTSNEAVTYQEGVRQYRTRVIELYQEIRGERRN